MDSERLLSILKGREGWNEEYSSIYEFKHHLDEGSDLGEEKLEWGWVLYERQLGPHPLLTLLKHIASHSFLMRHCIVQFWAVEKMEGPHHYLSTSNQCFCVGKLNKGVCWYRKLCSGHVYAVDMGGGDDEVIRSGSVGRAYRNKYPETTPDLRLYGGDEYPMWVGAARCGFRSYMALPLFDVHMTTCYGVLELLFHRLIKPTHLIPSLDQGLQISGLRSTHNSNYMPSFTAEMQYREGEITEVLELAAITVPRLYLTQVWILCKQCANSRCLERSSFLLNSDNDLINSWCLDIDLDMYTYLKACELHTLQIDSNLGHLSISKNPLAHYAQRARVSHSFAISLQIADMNSSNNHLYVLQFFLRTKRREDACDYSLQMLLRIMEMNFQSFKLVSGGKILEEHRQNPNGIPCESIDSLKAIKSYKQSFSEPNLVEYLEISADVVFRCIRPSSVGKGWVFCGDNINGGSSSTSIKEKVEDFMKKIAAQPRKHCQWIVQFWAPKMGHLQTSDQPYALGCLAKGLASFRKKCMKHYYFVGDDAEEEELGPPGRVFRSGHPEISPDLFLYTRSEFPIRNYAMHCFGRGYFALPIYLLNDEQHDHKCVGVLEFVGFIFSELYGIGKTLKEAKLCSTHIDFKPRFSFDAHVVNNNSGKDVSTELSGGAIKQIYNGIPQLHMAKVWVPYGECISNSDRSRTACCMALLSSTNDIDSFLPTDEVHWIHVQPKKGIIGMLLASENNACFCRNLCEFTIADHPLSHFEMSRRCDACFAMCLQSSHTGDLVYVVEFFLIQGPATYEYLRSFLNFLLPMMKHELKSFKLAFGKELGEEMVVEVIEFCDADRLLGSSESKEADFFPIKFKSVQYSRRNAQEQDSKTREKGKRRKRFNLSLEVLKLNFGKKLKVVAEELGIGRSTIKRACREHGIDRWPSKENRKMNTSLSLSGNSQQERSTHHHHLVMAEEEVEKVIIKVEYEEDVIKFELDLSLGVVDKLTEKVASKLNLEMGSFKLKYWDEDEDEILLTCDDDLLLCPKTHTAKGQRCMQFFVQLISE